MALYHLSLKYHSRKANQNMVKAASYRRGTRLYDKSTGKWYDYSKKQDVLFSEIIAPEDAPEWVQDILALQEKNPDKAASELWSLCELAENRKDARLDVDLNIALPKELTLEQNIELVRNFVNEELCLRGMIVDVNIHWDDGNPHLHIMGTTREILEDRFGDKVIEFKQKKFLYTIREAWASKLNTHYEIHGIDKRVTHRSFKDLGLDTEPTEHVGSYGQILGEKSRVLQNNRDAQLKNCELYYKKPQLLIKEVTLHNATFTVHDIRSLAQKRLLNNEILMSGVEEKFERMISKALKDDSLVIVGEDIKGDIRYASREYVEKERILFESVEKLAKATGSGLDKEEFIKLLDEKYSYLNEAQRAAAIHCVADTGVACVIGRPGVGKTTLLKPVAEAYTLAGFNVIAMSPTGKVAESIGEALNIQSYTIDAHLKAWKSLAEAKARHSTLIGDGQRRRNQKLMDSLAKYTLTNKDIILVDEAGLLSTQQLATIKGKVVEAGATIRDIGDTNQIEAICAGGAFRGIIDKVGAAQVDEIVRQKIDWMKEASRKLGDLNIRDGFNEYMQRGHLHMGATKDSTIDKMVDDYFKDKKKHGLEFEDQLIMAYTNEATDSLNAAVRNKLIGYGALREKVRVIDHYEYAIDDRIVFLQNQNKEKDIKTIKGEGVGIKNGSLGTIDSFSGSTMYVYLDSGRLIGVDTNCYRKFKHGYALTVHKNQGNTAKRSYGYLQPHMNARNANVLGTRHQFDLQLYASHEDFKDFDHIIKTIGRNPLKELVDDYSISKENQHYFDRIKDYVESSIEAQAIFTEIATRCKQNNKEVWEDKDWNKFKDVKAKRNQLAKMILTAWDEHKVFAGQAGLSRQYIERHVDGKVMVSDAEKRAELNIAHFKAASEQVEYLHNSIRADVGDNDFSNHHHNIAYKNIVGERNQLAFIINEDSVLHRPFIKEEHLNWKQIESLAKEHSIDSVISSEYEKLPDDEKPYFDNIARYVRLKHEYDDIWQEIATASKQTDGINSSINTKIEQMQLMEIQRQKLAHNIFQEQLAHETFFDLLDVNKDELHKESYTYQMNNLIAHYDNTDDYKQCIKGWIEFDKQQDWNVVNDLLNKSAISQKEFDIEDYPEKLTDLQKLSSETYGKPIKLSSEFITIQDKNIENEIEIFRAKIIENYNNNTVNSIDKDLEHVQEIAKKTNNKDVQTELEAYQIIIDNSKLSQIDNQKVDSITKMLGREYERLEQEQLKAMKSGLSMNAEMKATQGLQQQQNCIAKTISILEPDKDLSIEFSEKVNQYEQGKIRQAKKLGAKQISEVKTKVVEIFNKEQNQADELIDVYNQLQKINNNSSTIKLEEKNLQQLSKAVAREIQANPEALILAKANSMEASINKSAEIELQDDLITQYQQLKDTVERERDVLPDFFDSEATKKIVSNRGDILHLARVIEQQPDLTSELDKEAVQEISKQAEQCINAQSKQINKIMKKEQAKGFEISYPL